MLNGRNLSQREAKLAILIAGGTLPMEAARQAGYAPSTVAKPRAVGALVAKPHVRAAVSELQASAGVASLVTRERVVAGMASIAFDEEATRGERMKALDGLSRMLGYDAPRQVEVGRPGSFSHLSDDELADEAARLRAQVDACGPLIDVTPTAVQLENGPGEEVKNGPGVGGTSTRCPIPDKPAF